MPTWKIQIQGLAPLKERFRSGTMTFEESRDAQVAVLRASKAYSAEDAEADPWSFAGIVDDDLATSETVEEFDSALSALYDVCDAERIWLDPIR
jgi:hypothetical protein